MKRNTLKQGFLAVLLLLGVFVSVDLVTQFTKKLREAPITVRGISEREVKSDLAVWSVSAKFLETEIETGIKKAEQLKAKFLEFCKSQGLQDAINENTFLLEISDNWANSSYGIRLEPNSTLVEKNLRYSITLRAFIKSKYVDKIEKANTDLVPSIPWVACSGNVSFYYTKFNELRNEMVQESFADAKVVAECIAKTARVQLGGIQKVTQGLFTIVGNMNQLGETDHLESTSLMKVIRTVSTVTFTIN